MTEGDIFGGDGCDGTETLRTDSVSETTIGDAIGWGAATVDCGVNFDGNVGKREGDGSGVSTSVSAGMAELRSAATFFIVFYK